MNIAFADEFVVEVFVVLLWLQRISKAEMGVR
jgi:hypothetical protein